MKLKLSLFLSALSFLLLSGNRLDAAPDLILHNAKVVTVDRDFSIRQAVAVEDGRITAVGSDQGVLRLRGPSTRVVDLQGRVLMPGIIDSHIHPGAAMTEFDHEIPVMETIADVLAYVRHRATVVPPGEWISLRQVFITRLREQRYPTRAELDEAAPNHPVSFSTGPDQMLNSMALRISGIGEDFRLPADEPGFLERDPATGELTGLLRAMRGRYTASVSSGRSPSAADHYERLKLLIQDYNSVGITAVLDRSAGAATVERFQRMRDNGDLTVRAAFSRGVGTGGALENVLNNIRTVAEHPLAKKEDPMLRIIGIKTFLDGGMLTGSAYMRQPWGESKIYGISDPGYRGVLNIPYERLLPMVRTAVESGLQFTAHVQGDGAVHLLLDAYEEVNRDLAIRTTRPSLTHSSFMSYEAVQQAARLGVVVDLQPTWLYLDARTLQDQFGYERLRYFQPLRTMFEAGAIGGGGTDHMQKIGSFRSVNPYNPFLSIWVTLTRKARWYEGSLHPEEALTREQAIRFYTANNAYIMFMDDLIGSLEPGKRADFIVLDRDILTCDVDDIVETQVLQTYLDGNLVYSSAGDGG